MKKIRFYPLFSSKSLLAITKLSYSIGAVLVVFALVLSTGVMPVNASSSAASSQQGTLFCDLSSYSGTVYKVEDQDSPWVFTAPEPGYFSVVGIKAATECAQIFTADGTSTCYRVSGIGTDKVTVWDLEDAPSSCREISHLEIMLVDPAPTSTPQDPTSTPQDPTSTPQDPTSTPQDPTSTPQDPTSTPQDPTSTPQDPTSTPVPTSTPQDPTSTPQDPTSTPQDPTSTLQDPTSTPQDPTSTPQDPTSTPQDPTSTPQDPTSTPVPTAPPPDGGSGELLIPVTGLEMPFSSANSATKQEFMTRASTNLGLLFFGLGMVFHGAGLWKKRSDEQD